MSQDSKKVLYVASPGPGQETKGTDFYIAPISLKEGRATGPATLAFKGWQSPNPQVAERVGAWSPDGAKIAMPHKSDQGNELWVLSTDGGKPIVVTQTPEQLGPYPQWSPDSKRICGR